MSPQFFKEVNEMLIPVMTFNTIHIGLLWFYSKHELLFIQHLENHSPYLIFSTLLYLMLLSRLLLDLGLL